MLRESIIPGFNLKNAPVLDRYGVSDRWPCRTKTQILGGELAVREKNEGEHNKDLSKAGTTHNVSWCSGIERKVSILFLLHVWIPRFSLGYNVPNAIPI